MILSLIVFVCFVCMLLLTYEPNTQVPFLPDPMHSPLFEDWSIHTGHTKDLGLNRFNSIRKRMTLDQTSQVIVLFSYTILCPSGECNAPIGSVAHEGDICDKCAKTKAGWTVDRTNQMSLQVNPGMNVVWTWQNLGLVSRVKRIKQDDNYEEAERLAQASATLGKKDRNPRRGQRWEFWD